MTVNVVHHFMSANDPIPFEVEFPEEGKILMQLCEERAKRLEEGKVIHPIIISALPNPTVGRNEPCPCGSKLKFKKCCGKA